MWEQALHTYDSHIIFAFLCPARLTDALTISELVHVALDIRGCGPSAKKDQRVCQRRDRGSLSLRET